MPTATKPDPDLIESAYQDQVGFLFKQFFISLTGEKGTTNDGKWLAAFKLGLSTLKRAKALALGAVGPSAPAAASIVADTNSIAHHTLAAMTSDAATKPRKRRSRRVKR